MRSGLRVSACLLLALAPAWAAIWPDQIPPFFRTSASPVAAAADRGVWDEYGFDQAERAVYEAGGKRYATTAWRFRDATGAMAAWQWLRPQDAVPVEIVSLGVAAKGGLWMAYGNYVLAWEDRMPTEPELRFVFDRLPRLEQSPRPAWIDVFPWRGRVANSERYILGPASLEKFEPRIAPSLAAFHYGTEAQLGRFAIGGKEFALLLLNYPTPKIARDRQAEFEKTPGALVKRAGPMVAVVLAPADANAAEIVLANVRYQASVTWSDTAADRTDLQRFGEFILNVFMFIGMLILFSAFSGLAVVGIRRVFNRSRGGGTGGDSMIVLDLRDK
jgi:hypothetical protein